MIRVVVAEGSATIRKLLVEILESDPEIRVVGQATNGVEAIRLTAQLKPDLVAMDVHLPVLDGLAATREIMVEHPTPILVVSSSASTRDVELSLDATRAGALMLVAKPDNPESEDFESRRSQLISMAKAMAGVKVVRRKAHRDSRPNTFVLPEPAVPARIVAIAASTGGPTALQQIFSTLPGNFSIPILVVQHLATGFVGGLVEWLNRSCDLSVKVPETGENLVERTVYIAPDDRHLGVDSAGRAVISADPPIKGFRPSGTYLFRSAARAYGTSLVAVILTGMGDDGVDGLKTVKEMGGLVLAQDEATSVVYGMPCEAVAAGVVDAELPISKLAIRIAKL